MLAEFPFRYHQETQLEIAQLWECLSDTETLDQSLGMPAVHLTEETDRLKKGHYQASVRVLGLTLRYEEYPFEWVEQRFLQAYRRFHNGPFVEMSLTLGIEPGTRGARLVVEGSLRPRNALGTLLCKTVLERIITKELFAFVRKLEAHKRAPEIISSPTPMRLVFGSQLGMRLSTLLTMGIQPALLEKLKTLILEAPDLEVGQIRPFVLADRWLRNRHEVLRLMLFAVKAELLDLLWVVLCPNCRAPSTEQKSLSEIRAEAHCETCQIRYDANFSLSVEARFSVNPAVRIAQAEVFCIGGPANRREAVVQLRLQPGETRKQTAHFEEGKLRIGCFQTGALGLLDVRNPTKNKALSVRCTIGGIVLSSSVLSPGDVHLEFTNELPHEALLYADKETWVDNAATAALVTSLQEFRELFPNEAVAPGEELGVAGITILFTDLSASTELYQKAGDARAFSMIKHHFQFLTEVVRNHHGGVVKMMGDSVMASFATSRQALEAGYEMQRDWDRLCKERGMPDEVALKIGLHAGQCITINNRGKMDYFGTTINIAARVQAAAAPREVLFTETIFKDPSVQSFLETWKLHCDHREVSLKGIEPPQTLYSVRPATAVLRLAA